jgi:DNA repair ATPase RecN
MTPAEVQNQLRSARSELEHVCKLLESPAPASLDRCAAIMGRVVAELEAARRDISQAGELAAAEARRLQPVIHRVRSLLELAARYHSRWRQILAAMSGGYTVMGAPTPIRSQARFSIQG